MLKYQCKKTTRSQWSSHCFTPFLLYLFILMVLHLKIYLFLKSEYNLHLMTCQFTWQLFFLVHLNMVHLITDRILNLMKYSNRMFMSFLLEALWCYLWCLKEISILIFKAILCDESRRVSTIALWGWQGRYDGRRRLSPPWSSADSPSTSRPAHTSRSVGHILRNRLWFQAFSGGKRFSPSKRDTILDPFSKGQQLPDPGKGGLRKRLLLTFFFFF